MSEGELPEWEHEEIERQAINSSTMGQLSMLSSAIREFIITVILALIDDLWAIVDRMEREKRKSKRDISVYPGSVIYAGQYENFVNPYYQDITDAQWEAFYRGDLSSDIMIALSSLSVTQEQLELLKSVREWEAPWFIVKGYTGDE